MAPRRDKENDAGPPGAGTLFVYAPNQAPEESRWESLPTTVPLLTPSPDSLLLRGIADYTYLPASAGGILGRGKFSTVYRVTAGATSASGKVFALKHTPLYPHHALIAARLLREPTLLAQLTPHPCLIGVDGFVRTDAHFYLVEECASSHVPLPQHPLPLRPTRAARLLDQLVSVVRDCLHAGRVCHRDLKGDNVLVDVDTGNILLLDLGLATHFSASEPKLTTCCGSPAFHSPEIVHALNNKPGEVTYYGPEIDIWCIALTLLSLLLQTRFPLGPTHTSRQVMRERAMDVLQELDELYPPSAPWQGMGLAASSVLSEAERQAEADAWPRVRNAMNVFVDLDRQRRMTAFNEYDVGDEMRQRVHDYKAPDTFKTTSFIPTDIKYTLPLYLDQEHPDQPGPIVLRNPTGEPQKRIISYLKYLLRSAGILYHHVPDTHPVILQLVLPIGPVPAEPDPAVNGSADPGPSRVSWIPSLLGIGKKPPPPGRSASVPPVSTSRSSSPAGQPQKGKKAWSQQVRGPSASSSRRAKAPTEDMLSLTLTERLHHHTTVTNSAGGINGHATAVSHTTEVSLESVTEGQVPLSVHATRHLQWAAPPSPSPLSRQVTPDSGPPSPTATRAPGIRREPSNGGGSRGSPRVILYLTEPRGYELIRKALSAAVPTSNRPATDTPPPVSPATALAIPLSGSSGNSSSASTSDAEEEQADRGRARSKETPPDRDSRSETVRPGTKGDATPVAVSVSPKSRPLSNHKTKARSPKSQKEREGSVGTPTGVAAKPRVREPSGFLESFLLGRPGSSSAEPLVAMPRRSSSVPPFTPRPDRRKQRE
ncbi:Serine/threonine-protein kinase MARK2 [Vanrija pseudolonga]|uniref:Serine/threonine-protein kinase MARK2 n=1 Tax=Vanrija pseudolonga TaxID=143232 RepID=A0AAF1BHK2_9TREE|nr:Serine/threonine-protein kinase MARK2 [Vanrija pseudolonga]